MRTCEVRIDVLREELEQYIWTFRWVWLANLAAFVWGIVARHYDVIVIAAISALVGLIGVGRTRRGRRLVDHAANACLPQRDDGSEEEPEQGQQLGIEPDD